jgi:hypothetical protein
VGKSVKIYEALLVDTDNSHSRRYHALIQLAVVLKERFLYAGNQADFESAMMHSYEALEKSRAEDMLCPTVLVSHAGILEINAQRTSDSRQSWRLAESQCREAIPLLPTGHPSIATAHTTLGWILFRCFGATGTREYIEEAVKLQRESLNTLLPSQYYDKPRHLRRLCVYLRARYENLGDFHDLDDAISAASEAMQLCPRMHVAKYLILESMMNGLRLKYHQCGALEHLDKALDLGREALATSDCFNGNQRSSLLNTMSMTLTIYHQVAGVGIGESIKLSREALKCCPQESLMHRWMYTYTLGTALTFQFRRNGDLGVLEEASELYREVMQIVPEDDRLRPELLIHLSSILVLRSDETGELSYLNDAIDLDRRAVAAISSSDLSYGEMIMEVTFHLCMRYEKLHRDDDFEETMTLLDKFLESTPDGHVDRPEAVCRRSKMLLLHGQNNHKLADVEQAIQDLTQLRPALDKPVFGPESLRTLVASHLTRFRQTRDVEDAVCAVDIVKKLLDTVIPGHYERFQCLIDAAELYMEPDTPSRDIALALDYFAEAIADVHRDVRFKIQGLKTLLDKMELRQSKDIYFADSASLLPSKLLDIYASATALLPRLAYFGLHLCSRLQSLAVGQEIALRGASHALNLSSPERALEILEQGRATFWAHNLRLRSAFDNVPEEFRVRLTALARNLEHTSNVVDRSQDAQIVEKETALRRKNSEEFNALVEQIRCFPGLERFMLHDTYSTLARAAKDGPIVVLVSSTLTCHAILLNSSEDPIGISLDSVTDTWLVGSGSAWRSAVTDARSAMRDSRLKVAKSTSSKSKHSNGKDILRRLWTNIVWPILLALRVEVSVHMNVELPIESINLLVIQPASGRSRPRIWWCPTGNFAQLPIHAAGDNDRWCSDYVVSSYTPTLGALIAAREAFEPLKKQEIKALVAAVPRSDMRQWPDLTSTREEAMSVRSALPEGALIQLPRSDDAAAGGADGSGGIRADVLLERLPEATVLHLACHGLQHPENPLQSGFVMRDAVLTIERLMPVPLPRAFMAFLSACETAKGDKVSIGSDGAQRLNATLSQNQPDQAVHLAATMLFAGFKSVIATLW